MTRITEAMLDARAARLNRMTGSPAEPYTNGKANVGNYHISHAYGGVCLHRMHNEGGGVSCPIIGGHVPKRELLGLIDAYIAGLQEVTA
jgi:hypothetical protein